MADKRVVNEDGAVQLSPLIIITGGLALVVVIAGLWIGNTTAGVAADTANCVTKVTSGNLGAQQNVCYDRTNNAKSADYSRQGGRFITGFGSDAGSGSASGQLSIEAGTRIGFERGLERFSGGKSKVYTDVNALKPLVTSATTRAQMEAVIAKALDILLTAEKDGETSVSGETEDFSVKKLEAEGNQYAVQAREVRQLGHDSNVTRKAVQQTYQDALANINSLSVSQLKAIYNDSLPSLKTAQELALAHNAGAKDLLKNMS